jgi:site-specific recombinase XerD
MNREQALAALERAELLADHLPTTRQTYRRVIADYLARVERKEIADFQGYLDFLSADLKVSSKTVWGALNAGVFFCKHVLGKEPPVFRMPPKRSGRRTPVFLTHPECLAILSQLERVQWLQCALMYGCGLRVSEMATLRLKDLDFASGMLTVRGGKGDKDRTVRLPQSLAPALEDQVRRCKAQWARDNAAGRICPSPSPSLMRKLGRAQFARLPWYWLFPSRVTRGEERWHCTPHGIAKAMVVAAEAAGILKRVSPHVWRHSYATNLLRSGTDIRTLQDQLGHTHVETTEIYAHAVGFRGAESPLDKLGSEQPPSIIPFRRASA